MSFWEFQWFCRTRPGGYIVRWPIYRRNISAPRRTCAPPLTSSRDVCVQFVIYTFKMPWLPTMKRKNTKTYNHQSNVQLPDSQLAHSSRKVATTGHTRLSANFLCTSKFLLLVSSPSPYIRVSLRPTLHPLGLQRIHSKQYFPRHNRLFSPLADAHSKWNVCPDRVSSFGHYYAFPLVSSPRTFKNGRVKKEIKTNISNITNSEPIDTVRAPYIPEPTEIHKSSDTGTRELPEAEQLKSNWTENVKAFENCDTQTDELFAKLS